MTEIKNSLNLTHDQIEKMFDAQYRFNCMVIPEYNNIPNWDNVLKATWTRKQKTAFLVERVELLDSVNWKWWMKPSVEDIQNAQVEVIDMLHFLISLYQINYSNPIEQFIVDTEEVNTEDNFVKDNSEDLSEDVYSKFLDMINSSCYMGLKYIAREWCALCQDYNLVSQDLFNKYFQKMQVNIDRQLSKQYSKETKDPDDCKHI